MRRAAATASAGAWPADEAADTVTLAFDDRARRRIRLETDSGAPFLLDLADTVRLADGDGLRLDDGGWIAVRAAPEPLVEVTAETAGQRARIAWHLGNRHVPAEILPGALRFRDDAVIVRMIEGLGAKCTRIEAPFQPEPGAYHRDGHGHG